MSFIDNQNYTYICPCPCLNTWVNTCSIYLFSSINLDRSAFREMNVFLGKHNLQSKCKLELTMIFLESWWLKLTTDKDICKCKFRTDLICKILTWRLEMQFTFAMHFYYAASYQVSMLNVHEVLWFAPTTPTSQMNRINDCCANMVMITNHR